MRKTILTWLALCAALFGAWQLSALDIPHFKSARIERLLVSPAHAQLTLTGGGCGAGTTCGSGGAWTPASLPGLVLWLSASHGVSTSGSNLTAWADQSGNNYNCN